MYQYESTSVSIMFGKKVSSSAIVPFVLFVLYIYITLQDYIICKTTRRPLYRLNMYELLIVIYLQQIDKSFYTTRNKNWINSISIAVCQNWYMEWETKVSQCRWDPVH